MPFKPSRRAFFQQSALAGAGFWVAGMPRVAAAKSANEKLGIAVIGVAGQGGYDLNNVAHESIVALCDVDENRAAEPRKRFPKARFYTDFRQVFDQKDIDAVVVATPDHTHAAATLMALRAGKHVYCEKPLTHTVEEVRLVAATAARQKRTTQMGTQIHALPNYRRVVELIRAGAIGAVREVHVWVGKIWSGGGDRPTDTPKVPAGLHYDLWLGPAAYRPYHPAYLPAKWRGWWDFGGGTLSDMACHYMDLPHWALYLRHARTIEAEGPPVHPESTPSWLIVRYEYPERHGLPPVKLTWYDGGKRPAGFSDGSLPKWGDGVLFVGEKGKLLADYNKYVLLPKKAFRDYVRPLPSIPNSIGHHREWTEACKTGGGTTCNFAYAGALAETVLLGDVAFRTGQKLEWDAEHGKVINTPDAAKYLTREYRKGWEI